MRNSQFGDSVISTKSEECVGYTENTGDFCCLGAQEGLLGGGN